MKQVSFIDISIIAIYLIFIIWWGLKNAKNKDSNSYFLAGQNMKWWAVGLALFAASVSSSTLIGQSGEGFISGIAVYNYQWVSVLVMVFFAAFFLPFYLKNKIYTMPEFLERRFDARSRYYFSFITIIGNVFLDAAAALYSGALIINIIFPQADFQTIIIIMALIAGSYTIIGGLSSVINVEFIQAIILIIGSLILSIFAINEIGGWQEFHDKFSNGLWLHLTRPLNDPTTPWLGMIIGIPILAFYFWGNNQVMVQRVLSAKSVDHGRKGILLVGFLYLITLFIFIAPGLCARAMNIFGIDLPNEIIPGNQLKAMGINTDKVYPTLITNLLPIGLIGVMIAAMISALTSALSATINSVSTLFTMDFYSKFNKKASSKTLVKVGQITSLIILIIAIIWAPNIRKFESLVSYYQEIISYLAPPIVATFFIGLFSKRANGQGAFVGLMSGLGIAALIMSLKYILEVPIPLHFLIIAPIIFVTTLLISILVSYCSTKPDEETIKKYTWSKQIWTTETIEMKGMAWYKNYRVISVILIICCFLMYLLYM